MRRATRAGLNIRQIQKIISIHALLAESDTTHARIAYTAPHFYPRSPCGERPRPIPAVTRVANFYPRSPCGERPRIFFSLTLHKDFYPRSPCGERHCNFSQKRHPLKISIHALLAESDQTKVLKIAAHGNFYPRSPCGERHPAKSESLTTYFISIHALLAESDLQRLQYVANSCISIHALLAESDGYTAKMIVSQVRFLSTLSLRRATRLFVWIAKRALISIHALLAESDL